MAGNPNNPKDHGHELDPSGPVAMHGDPEHAHDHGGTQKRRRRR